MNYNEYVSKYELNGRNSILAMVPLEHLDDLKTHLKEFEYKYKLKYRIRYRGPRNLPEDIKNRPQLKRQAECLKKYATHFSVYRIWCL